MSARFKIDLGRLRQILAGPKVRSGMQRVIGDVEAKAKQIAQAEAYDTGAYMRGIVGAVAPDGIAHTRIVGTDFKSAWIEAGVRGRPPVATLRRAVESVGLRVTSTPRRRRA